VHLPGEPHIGAPLDRHRGARHACLREQRARIALELSQDGVDGGRIGRLRDGQRMRAHALEAERRGEKAEARGDARGGWNDHLATAKNARHPGRVRRPGAAEADDRVVARILAFLDEMDARRRRHALGDDLVNAVRRLERREPDLPAQASERRERRVAIERHAPAEEEGRVVIAER